MFPVPTPDIPANVIEELGASNTRGAVQLASAQNALWQLRYGFPQFMVLTDKAARDKIVADEAKWYKEIDDNIAAFKKSSHSPEEVAALRGKSPEEVAPKGMLDAYRERGRSKYKNADEVV